MNELIEVLIFFCFLLLKTCYSEKRAYDLYLKLTTRIEYFDECYFLACIFNRKGV